MAEGAPHVVSTKLRPPRVQDGLLERVDLLQRLRGGGARRLTLVCAPAGYGKTTLLAQWAAADAERTPFVWVSLDERDSDPVRLWSHVVAGLHGVHEPAGERSLVALAIGPSAIAGTVVPLLIEELEDAPPLALVLDDWQAVRNPLCDQTMGTFVERSPEAVQVVVSSRSDPGLPVARLRAHGDLVEVRPASSVSRTTRQASSFVASTSSSIGLTLRASPPGPRAGSRGSV